MYALEEMTLVELVEKGAKHYGERPALSMFGGDSLSYAGLDKASGIFSQKLLSYGVEDGDKVALLVENSQFWAIAYFAILRAGAIAVPILVDFHPEQIANILKHSKATAVICSEKLEPKLKPSYGSLAIIGIAEGNLKRKGPAQEKAHGETLDMTGTKVSDRSSPVNAKKPRTPHRPSSDDLAMIIYTSGTTGSSKGVMLSHKNVLSNALACRSIIILHRTDRVLSILPLAHTYEFTIGFIIPLLAGSHIHYLDRPPSATVLLPALKAIRPTIMLSVPLVIEKIYRSSIKPTLEGMKLYSNKFFKPLLIRFAGIKLKITFGGRIRFFGVGGAPLSAEAEIFLKKAKFPYAIGYGLTECSPLLAGCPPSRTFIRSTGPALKGVQLRIADPNPSTGEGEIQAKGDNIFKGYYLDDEKTAEAFTEDGWFRTGDLGFVDKKKRVFVRGRIKTMILGASGENIYPEEIEAVLNQSPYVMESLVVEGDTGLTAFVYLKSEVLENFGARIQDGLDAAGELSSRLGTAIANAEKSVASSLGHAFEDAEKKISQLLEGIRKETNTKLSSFSKINNIKLQEQPFEKTPTQKIKRFLYTKQGKSEKKD
jgi:long-chain acyl-CoA synthetase